MEKSSFFVRVPNIPSNKLFDLKKIYEKSENPNKMNLSIGMLYNEDGSLVKFESVETAQKMIHADDMNKEYPPITGVPEYNLCIQRLFFPDSSDVVIEKRILTTQSVTGGSSLRVGAEIIYKFLQRKIHLSNLTFGPYRNIYSNLEISYYPYFDESTQKLDVDSFVDYLNKIDNKSNINLQLSGHNPTALDLSKDDWERISQVMSLKSHIAFFDVAYLGYGKGSIEDDLYPIHLFAERKIEMLISYSSAKNFANFSDDVGAMIIVLNNPEALIKLKTHLIVINRSLFSFSSLYGARIIERILNNESLKNMWIQDLKKILYRISYLRKLVWEEMESQNVDFNYDFLKQQKGIYIFLNLSENQVEILAKDYSIFLCDRGRINILSIDETKIKYLVSSLKEVLKLK